MASTQKSATSCQRSSPSQAGFQANIRQLPRGLFTVREKQHGAAAGRFLRLQADLAGDCSFSAVLLRRGRKSARATEPCTSPGATITADSGHVARPLRRRTAFPARAHLAHDSPQNGSGESAESAHRPRRRSRTQHPDAGRRNRASPGAPPEPAAAGAREPEPSSATPTHGWGQLRERLASCPIGARGGPRHSLDQWKRAFRVAGRGREAGPG